MRKSGLRLPSITAGLALFAILNAVLYASLLPLWEGFDEPFHYGYVQTVSRRGVLPVLGRSGLSEEVRESLRLAPASEVVRHNLPEVMTYAEYFRLDAAGRAARRATLAAIPAKSGWSMREGGVNYEAQQAPLAYLVLAIPDRLWAEVPLPERIWRLRLICALAAGLGMLAATLGIAARAGLPPVYGQIAAFLVLSTQTLWAATAHVANDWLAIPLAGLLFWTVLRYVEAPDGRRALAMGMALAAGLLAKAYFLALAPLPLALVLWRRRGMAALLVAAALVAGPWYGRNIWFYGNLSGTLPEVRPPLTDLFSAALRMPWLRVLADSARRNLWTGNNTFTSFSALTLNALLGLLAAAAACTLWRWKKGPHTEQAVLAAGCALFSAAMLYSNTALFLRFGEAAYGGAPWYSPVLFPAAFVLLAGGLSRGGAAGRAIAAAMVCGWTYLIAATYWVKLIPLYGGMEGRATLAALARWYFKNTELLALRPRGIIYGLGAAVTVAALALAATLLRGLWKTTRV